MAKKKSGKKKKLTEAEQDRLFEKAERILDKHYKKILRRKGVQAVEVNYRVRKGKVTDEIVICIHVENKIDPEKLRPNQIFTDIEGIPIDIVESKNTYSKTVSVTGGDKIAPAHNVAAAGTLGIVCKDEETGDEVLLTNAHVLFGEKTKSSLGSKWEMRKIKNGNATRIGDAIKDRSFRNASVDCGLIEPDDGITLEKGVPGIAPNPSGMGKFTRRDVRKRVKVKKRGQKTGITEGKLVSISLRFKADGITFSGQIGIKALDDKPGFLEGGDSGSVVIHKNKIKGLLHGLTDDKKTAVACHMDDVADKIDIEI